MLFVFSLIIINYFFRPSCAVELYIHKSVTEIRQNYQGNGIYTHVFPYNEYENLIDGSISWDGTPFVKQELYHTNDTLKNALVTVKQLTLCDCKTIQAKIVDPQTMLLENLETGTYFYASKQSLEYKYKTSIREGVTLTFHFNDTKANYNGTLSYLLKGITWLPNYDLSITSSDTCILRGYAVIRNHHQQEYAVNNTYLFSGDIQLVKSPSLTAIRRDNSSAKSIELTGEEKGFYFYSFKTPYVLRSASTVRLPFISAIPQCQFYYKATTTIHKGQYKGVFRRHYDLITNQFLPAGILTIRDNQVLIGQSSLSDVPANYTQTIILGQDSDVRYLVESSLISIDEGHTKDSSSTYELYITINNFKNKMIQGQLEFHGSSRLMVHETTCRSGRVDGNMYIVSIEVGQGGTHHCQFNVTL